MVAVAGWVCGGAWVRGVCGGGGRGRAVSLGDVNVAAWWVVLMVEGSVMAAVGVLWVWVWVWGAVATGECGWRV